MAVVKPYFCTSLPGQSAWLQQSTAQGIAQPSSGCNNCHSCPLLLPACRVLLGDMLDLVLVMSHCTMLQLLRDLSAGTTSSKRARIDDADTSNAEESCTVSEGKSANSKHQRVPSPVQSSDEPGPQTKHALAMHSPIEKGCNIRVGLAPLWVRLHAPVLCSAAMYAQLRVRLHAPAFCSAAMYAHLILGQLRNMESC